MKVQVCRASGNPLNFEHHQPYQDEYRAYYDKVALHVTEGQPNRMTQEQAERGDKIMERLRSRLQKKYPANGVWNVKLTKKGLHELVKQHGPIALGTGFDGQLALVIMDNGFET